MRKHFMLGVFSLAIPIAVWFVELNLKGRSPGSPPFTRPLTTPLELAAASGSSLPEIKDLESKDEAVRLAAVEALGKRGASQEGVLPALIQVVQKDERRSVRWRAAKVLASFGPASRDAVPVLIQILSEEEGRTVVIPGEMWTSEDCVEIHFLHTAAVYCLVNIGEPAIPLLLKELERGNGGSRDRLCEALIKMGPPGHTALFKALKEDEGRVGDQAAYALVQAGFVVVPALIEAIANPNEKASARAILALTDLCRKGVDITGAIPALLQALDRSQDSVRHRAVTALEEIGPAALAVVPDLTRHLQEKSPKKRTTQILHGMGRKVDEQEIVRLASQELSKAAVPGLIAALDDKEDFVRANAAIALAQIGTVAPEAIPALTKALTDPSDRVRAVAVEALKKIDSREVFPDKLEPQHPALGRETIARAEALKRQAQQAEGPPVQKEGPSCLVIQLGPQQSINSAVFSPDGRQILTSGEATPRLWDTATGRLIREFAGDRTEVGRVAFSPGGRYVLTGSYDKTARLWEAATGMQIRQFPGHASAVLAVAFSPDSRWIVTTDTSGEARVWELATGKERCRFEGHAQEKHSQLGKTGMIVAVSFSPDGEQVATAANDGTCRLWDAATGQGSLRLEHRGRVTSVAFSPDGRHLLTGSYDGTAQLWDAASGTKVRLFESGADPVTTVTISPNGQHVLVGKMDNIPNLLAHNLIGRQGGILRLLDFKTGKGLHRLTVDDEGVLTAAFSPDSQQVFTAGSAATVKLWDVYTGKEVRSFKGAVGDINAAAFSPNGRWLSTAGGDKTAHLWDLTLGAQVRVLKQGANVTSLAFSPDSTQLATGGWDRTARLWDLASGKETHRLTGHSGYVESVAFTPDGRQVLTGSRDGTAFLWNVSTGKADRWLLADLSSIYSVAVSSDGRHFATGSRKSILFDTVSGREIRAAETQGIPNVNAGRASTLAFSADGRELMTPGQLRNVATGKETRTIPAISPFTFSPDGQWMAACPNNQTVVLYDFSSGREVHRLAGHKETIASIAFSPDSKWVLTGSADSTARLWEVATGTYRCSLVSFRDGSWAVVDREGRFDAANLDEVKGLHWIMPDDPLTPLSIETFMRDYYEPRLLAHILSGETFKPIRDLQSLNRVQPMVQISQVEPLPGQPDEVRVTVEVVDKQRDFYQGSRKITRSSSAFDLRLFRDGRLVARHPTEDGEVRLDAKTGRATIVFEHVKLPRSGQNEVEFSAYAFNADRVKSDTHRLKHPLPETLTPRKGIAYVVCMGVNAFDDPKWNLKFAAPDARAMSATLREMLGKSDHYERVVEVLLVSDAGREDGKRVFGENAATKENLRSVLAVLAGQKNDERLLKTLPVVAELAAARPEDLVLIAFSTHGHNSTDGRFYLLPSDIGSGHDGKVTEELLRRSISTDNLSSWLRGVDAGEMVMVVDACHSAGSVEQDGFKPGPMGSRGLGQLAYDKRMRILAASQAADVAFEDPRIGHGLLTYSLCQNGLIDGLADFDLADKRITMGEWLRYGVKRVPELADEIAAGKVQAVSSIGRGLRKIGQKQTVAQLPSLFDFTKGIDGVILSGQGGATNSGARKQ